MVFPSHLERWIIGRGLRGRLVATLCAVLVPAIIVGLIWAQKENRSLRTLRVRSAEQTSVLVATRIEDAFRQAHLLAAGYLQNAGTAPAADLICSGFPTLAKAFGVPVTALALFRDNRPVCSAGPGEFDPARVASLLALPGLNRFLLGPERSKGLAVAPSPSVAASGPGIVPANDQALILVGWSPVAQPGMVAVMGLSQSGFTEELDLSAFARGDGAAVLDDAGRVLAERHNKDGRNTQWLTPAAAAYAGERRSFELPSGDGTNEHYVLVPIAGTSARLIVGYATGEFFAPQQRQFWITAIELLGLLAATIVAGVWAVDRALGQWVGYFRRIAIAHSKGRLTVRARSLDNAPTELADLGQAINRMADNMAGHLRMLELAGAEKAELWQELQHRVKNNFQVIASLLNLYKKSLPAERRQDVRFIEDHVQSMAIAYRVAYASNENSRVPPGQLIREVIAALADIAGIRPERVIVEAERDTTFIDLDKAIALGLYLAYFLPPHLDAMPARGTAMRIAVLIQGDNLAMSFTGLPAIEPFTALRQRLLDAYIRQLRAEVTADAGLTVLNLPLYGPVSTLSPPSPRPVPTLRANA